LLLAIGAAPAAAENIPSVTVDDRRQGGVWTAEYTFLRQAPAWVFARSPVARVSQRSWRPESWTIETKGVRLERHGHYDVLVTEKGGAVPTRVRIRFTPFSEDILTGYDAALVFTDGSVALFDQQFKAFPVGSVREAAALPIDLDNVRAAGPPTRTTFRDSGGRVLYQGKRHEALTLDDAGTYVVYGPAEPIVTENFSAIFDPGLPAWLRSFLVHSTPEIIADYARVLGPAPGIKPTVMVSWQGPTPELISMGGSVLPGLVTMTFEGAGVLEERPEIRNQARWFIAHESAHFWLGQTVRYATARQAWIFEGGADLLAIRTVAATDAGYDARAELQRALDDCIAGTKGKSIEGAPERQESRTAYACGAVLSLIAEATSGDDFARWLRPQIDASRADGVLTRAEWLAALGKSGGSADMIREIALLLDRGSADPAAVYAALFRRAGVSHRVDAGRLVLS
jgi:hypothetical protein